MDLIKTTLSALVISDTFKFAKKDFSSYVIKEITPVKGEGKTIICITNAEFTGIKETKMYENTKIVYKLIKDEKPV